MTSGHHSCGLVICLFLILDYDMWSSMCSGATTPDCASGIIWKEMLSVVKGAGGRLLKQDAVIGKLQKNGLPIFRDLVFDSQTSGGRMDKYQCPLMISPKRWCNGSACFTKIASVGQLLNLMDNTKPGLLTIEAIQHNLVEQKLNTYCFNILNL